MTDPRAHAPDPAPDHDRHDLLLVSALAAGDVEARDRARAELQVAACAACTQLHADLLAIAVAAATLPEPARPRDFTLTRDDAARLRRPSLRRLFVDVFGPRGMVGRPLATGVTTLGVIGVVAASSVGLFGGAAAGPSSLGTAGAPVPTQEGGMEGPTSVPGQDNFASGGPKSTDPGQVFVGSEPTPVPGDAGAPGAQVPGQDAQNEGAARSTDTGGSGRDLGQGSSGPLLGLSLGLVAIGLALFALRRVASRLS